MATMAKGILNLALLRRYPIVVGIMLGATLGTGMFPSLPRAKGQTPDRETSTAQASRADLAKPKSATVRKNPKDGLKYVLIPSGTFSMGCSPGDSGCGAEEMPAHQVTITKGFWLGQTDVTVAAYKRFAAASGKQMPTEPSSRGKELNPGWSDNAMPMVEVTWFDAEAYCGWAGGRLPSEAEWEYAARAGNTQARYGNLDAIAWYADNSGTQHLDSGKIGNQDPASYLQRLNDNGNDMHDVGLKQANAFGLYDMLGNVWEWVNDWYDQNYYQHTPSRDPSGPAREELRVQRGGSWNDFPWIVRASERISTFPAYQNNNLGFRCAEDVAAP